MKTLPLFLSACFAGLALMHLVWIFRPMGPANIPVENGQPVFKPGKALTLAVAVALGMAAVLAFALGTDSTGLPGPLLKAGNGGVALVMGLRGIGDFRYCGIFRRRKVPLFTSRDTWFYTPFCFAASIGLILSIFATN